MSRRRNLLRSFSSFIRTLSSSPFSPNPSPSVVDSGRGSTRLLGTLAFEEIRASDGSRPCTSTAFVLHGLLGSGRNWRSFARDLAEELRSRSGSSQDWRMVLVDLRNHGKSAGVKGLDPPHDMVNAARDLADLVDSQKWAWPEVVIGHSMGGKVAMEFAKSCSCGYYRESAVLPKQLWILDSVPGEVSTEDSDGEVEKVLKTLESLPSPLPSRRWVVDHMLKLGFTKSLSEWIGSNLKNLKGQVMWTFDIHAAIAMFNSYRETSYWPLLEHPAKGLDIAIVRAQNSDRWSPPIVQQLESLSRKGQGPDEGKVSLYTLPDSGHWVHVDNPKGLLEIMSANFLS